MAAADGQFTECRIVQDLLKTGPALSQDFFPMSDEKQMGSVLTALCEAPIIKGCDSRLAGSRSGDNEIPPMMALLAFDLQGIEDGLLIRIGPQREMIQLVLAGCHITVFRMVNCLTKLLEFICAAGIEFEIVGVPIRLKGCGHFFEDSWQILLSYLHVPFQSIGNGSVK